MEARNFAKAATNPISRDRIAQATGGDHAHPACFAGRQWQTAESKITAVEGFSLGANPVKFRPLAQSDRTRIRVTQRLSLGMTGEMNLDTLRQEALTSDLAAAGKGRATGLGFHASPKAMLLLARALGRLVSAFHRIKSKGTGKYLSGRLTCQCRKWGILTPEDTESSEEWLKTLKSIVPARR